MTTSDRIDRLRASLPFGVRGTLRALLRRVAFSRRVLRFWVRSILHRCTPGGFGRYRSLRASRDPTYEHARQMHPVRRKHHGAGGWRDRPSGGVLKREYADYDEYVIHQKQKLDELLKLGLAFGNRSVYALRRRFYHRFRHLVHLLPRDALILCAGARQGTEVEVLHDLGFENAYGIDLNPGPANPVVREGDFNRIEAPDSSIDLVYSNSVDHAFDLDAFFGEHARVVKPEGFLLYDLPLGRPGLAGPAESLAWEREDVVVEIMLRYFDRLVRVETTEGWKWLLLQGVR